MLHATESLHDFCVTYNTSTSGGIFIEVVSLDFSVEGYTIYTQQPGSFCLVPGGHGVSWPPYVALAGILEENFQDIGGYRLHGFIEFDGNTSVACNTISIQIRNLREYLPCCKCLHTLHEMEPLRFSVRWVSILLKATGRIACELHAEFIGLPKYSFGKIREGYGTR